MIYGCITGILCGIIIALFIACSRVTVRFALGLYRDASSPLAYVCIALLALMCCLTAAVIQTLVPSGRGSGIPLAEGAARGMLRVKWLRTAAALIAGSLLSFLSGLSLGSEGPSIGVGGLIGDGVGKLAKKPEAFRRYLITGGASSGLAVAFNAPLTGIAFALEETHRRFSAGIMLAAFSAVVPAVLVSQFMFWALGHDPYMSAVGIHAGFCVLPFLEQTPYGDFLSLLSLCGIAAMCGVMCALLASAFNLTVFALNRVFSKVRSAALRLLPVFALTVICGTLSYFNIGSGESALEELYDRPELWVLICVLVVRFVLTAFASGSGATGGLFLPMIAISGIFGTFAARLCVMAGLDKMYVPNIVILCVSAYFAASVRAPISAIALCVELTASFANILPCAIAVGVATAVAALLRSSPLYERMTEDLRDAALNETHGVNVSVCGAVFEQSSVTGKRIRDVLWPYNSLVTELKRGNVDIVPDGETVLEAGDILTVKAERVDEKAFAEQIRDYITTENSVTPKTQHLRN